MEGQEVFISKSSSLQEVFNTVNGEGEQQDVKKFCCHKIELPTALDNLRLPQTKNFHLWLSKFPSTVKCQCVIDGKEIDPTDNKEACIIDFITPGSEHSWQWSPSTITNKQQFSKFEIIIHADMVNQVLLEHYGKDISNFNISSIPLLYDDQLENILRYIEIEEAKGDSSNNAVITSALKMAIIHIALNYFTIKKRPVITGGLSDLRLKRVKSYIKENISQNISLDDLALISQYSRYHFLRAFKKSTGLSPNQYLVNQRISLACTLLENTKKSVTEVALSVGYENLSYFAKQFKKHTNVIPSKYRD